MNILVTGASGFIGRKVIEVLSKTDNSIFAVDIQNKLENVNFVKADIFSKLPKDFFKDIDVVLHLAYRNGFKHNDPSHKKDLKKHKAFLKAAIKAGVKKVVSMGTMHEIGYFEGAINADTPCNPTTNYGIAKNKLRKWLLCFAKKRNVNVQWIRAYYIYSNDLYGQNILCKIYQANEAGEKEFKMSSGEHKFDFISVDELAKQITCVTLNNDTFGIINCCSGKPVAMKDQVIDFIKANDLSIKPIFGAFPDREGESPCIYGDSTIIDSLMKGFKL